MNPVSTFTYKRRVQFPETDATGIVHFTNFFKYVEEAEHAMWRSVGLSIAARDTAIGWPRVAATFEYRRPLRFEDEFEVHLRVDQVTTRSLRYACRVECRGDVVAEGGMTIVCVERAADHTLRAVPIPEPIASLFRPPSPEAPWQYEQCVWNRARPCWMSASDENGLPAGSGAEGEGACAWRPKRSSTC